MAKIRQSKKISPVLVCLSMVVVMLGIFKMVVASDGGIYRSEFQPQEEGNVAFQSSQPSASLGTAISKDDIKRELTRQLLILQEAEENIIDKIRQLEAERRALSSRKRSHYSSMCMFNVVACYRK